MIGLAKPFKKLIAFLLSDSSKNMSIVGLAISIFNILGQQVKSVTLKNNINAVLSLDIANLSNGVYTIEINNGISVTGKRFVIKH